MSQILDVSLSKQSVKKKTSPNFQENKSKNFILFEHITIARSNSSIIQSKKRDLDAKKSMQIQM